MKTTKSAQSAPAADTLALPSPKTVQPASAPETSNGAPPEGEQFHPSLDRQSEYMKQAAPFGRYSSGKPKQRAPKKLMNEIQRDHNGRVKGIKALGAERTIRIAAATLTGETNTQIARVENTTQSTVRAVKRKFGEIFKSIDKVEHYRQAKGVLLSASGLRLLESINERRQLDQASLGERARAFKVINDAERLERSQSTKITEHRPDWHPVDRAHIIGEDSAPIDVTPEPSPTVPPKEQPPEDSGEKS